MPVIVEGAKRFYAVWYVDVYVLKIDKEHSFSEWILRFLFLALQVKLAFVFIHSVTLKRRACSYETVPQLRHKFTVNFVFFQLALIRGRYRTMRNEDQGTQDNFIMGFSNPKTESCSIDKADGRVTVLGYRPLREDGCNKDGVKGNLDQFWIAA